MSSKKCVLCGRCRNVCPVYLAVLKETAAPRAKAVFAQAGRLDKVFYLCTLCGSCRKVCPVDADLQVVENRVKLVESGKGTAPNKLMVENMRRYGNPFGEGDAPVSGQ